MNFKKILIITSVLFLILKGFWVLTEEKLERTFPHANGVIIIKSARVFPFYPFDDKLLLIYNQNTAEKEPKQLYSWSFCGTLSIPEAIYDSMNRVRALKPCYWDCQGMLPWEKGTDFYGAHLEVKNHSDGELTIELEFTEGVTEY